MKTNQICGLARHLHYHSPNFLHKFSTKCLWQLMARKIQAPIHIPNQIQI